MNSSCMNSTLRVALLPIYLLITARCGLASAPPCGSLSMASIIMVPIKNVPPCSQMLAVW